MKNINELNKGKLPLFKINNDLKKYKKDKVVFQEKLDLANKMLKNSKLPKISE